jgi:hypothetical protein
MNPRRREALRHQRQPFVPLWFSLFVVGPLELRERGAGYSAGLEPSVAVLFTTGAVSPSTLFRDIEWTRGIHGRFAAMRLADADELDEGSVHPYLLACSAQRGLVTQVFY